ncbi:MAG: tetC 2 [Phenylobacterium sp.]|nr:tetC 2 [Phenylobacterium sp.]
MSVRAGVRVERAAATRAALVAAARRLFAEKGYHATGTPDLVAAAGVTRGALYHHFRDKEDLFEAVFRQVANELERDAANEVAALADDPWRQLRQGVQSFLRLIATRPEVQRVLLVDGPAVFGWLRWRELESEFTFGHIVASLKVAMAQGVIRAQPAEPLAHLVLAALNDAAMSIAHADDPDLELAAAGGALQSLMEGLRVRA